MSHLLKVFIAFSLNFLLLFFLTVKLAAVTLHWLMTTNGWNSKLLRYVTVASFGFLWANLNKQEVQSEGLSAQRWFSAKGMQMSNGLVSRRGRWCDQTNTWPDEASGSKVKRERRGQSWEDEESPPPPQMAFVKKAPTFTSCCLCSGEIHWSRPQPALPCSSHSKPRLMMIMMMMMIRKWVKINSHICIFPLNR